MKSLDACGRGGVGASVAPVARAGHELQRDQDSAASHSCNIPQPKRMQLANGMVIFLRKITSCRSSAAARASAAASATSPPTRPASPASSASPGAPAERSRRPATSSTTFSKRAPRSVETGGGDDPRRRHVRAQRRLRHGLPDLRRRSCSIRPSARTKSIWPRRRSPPASRAATTSRADHRPRGVAARLRHELAVPRVSPSTRPSRRSRATISSRSTSGSCIRTTSSSASSATSTRRRWRRSCAQASRHGRADRKLPRRRRPS